MDKDLVDYRQQNFSDSLQAVHSNCMAHQGDPLSLASIAGQVDGLNKSGGLTTEFLDQESLKGIAKDPKKSDGDKIGSFSVGNSCRLPEIKISIENDKVKVAGKTEDEHRQDGNKLLVQFGSMQLDRPILRKFMGSSSEVIDAPKLSDREKAIAKEGLAVSLSTDESVIQNFAKNLLANPDSAKNVIAGLNWRDNGSGFKLAESEAGKPVLQFSSQIYGTLQINDKGETTYKAPSDYPEMTKEILLKEMSENQRKRLVTDVQWAEQLISEKSNAPYMFSRLKPNMLAYQANLFTNLDFDKMLRSQRKR